MLRTRPIITITIGYIIGIIIGLYFKISIVLFYSCFYLIYVVYKKRNKNQNVRFKLISIRRYSRYFKIIFTKGVMLLIIFTSIVSNTIIIYRNHKFESLYSFQNNEEIIVIGRIISNKETKEYKDVYRIKVENINSNIKYKNTNLYLHVKLNKNINFQYGDKIKIRGKYIISETSRNYKGFNYKEYLKTLNIYGIVDLDEYELIGKNKNNYIYSFSNKCFLYIKENIEKLLDKNEASVLLGLTLGYTDEINENIKNDFDLCNISHILAVSGMHIGYIISLLMFVFTNTLGKRKSRILTSIFIIFYGFLIGFTPSVARASISGIIVLFAGIFHRKSDMWNNICLSLLLLLVYNPFLIKNTSLLLSYGGTIGIVLFQKNILNLFKLIEEYNEEKNKRRRKRLSLSKTFIKIYNKIKEMIAITISANIMILPIIIYIYNQIPILSLIICVILSFIIGPIIIICFIFIIISVFINLTNFNFIVKIISFILNIFIKITEIGSHVYLNKIYVVTPNIFEIIIYYLFIFSLNYLFKLYHIKKLNVTQKRLKNIISLFKYKINQNKKKIYFYNFYFKFYAFFHYYNPKT